MKKKSSSKKRSRHIPEKISDAVKMRHFFECAWCGEKLYDRHHIHEFASGGLHSTDNLILLCPNCHRQLHNGEIAEADLIDRKSTHLKYDRISGGIPITTDDLTIRIGAVIFKNFSTPIAFGREKIKILALNVENGTLLLSARFYDKQGKLVFWMSSNRYWANSSFQVRSGTNYLEILNSAKSGSFLKLELKEDSLYLQGRNFYNGHELLFLKDKVCYQGHFILEGPFTMLGNPSADLIGICFE